MIPATFDYVRPTSLDEAISTLAEHGDGAKVLAGGHSLLPMMKLRLAMPEVLVDVGRVPELRGIRDEGSHLVIGAVTPHQEVLTDERVRHECGLLAEASAEVGDPQVRHRGTLGGSLAHGDAAGDLPAVALALEAEMVLQGPSGSRTVPAQEFFVDFLETALAPDEVLVEVRFPKVSGWGHRYEKFNRVAQAWAIVGAAALVRVENGQIAEARIGLTNMGPVPFRATTTESALAGAQISGSALESAASQADDGTNPGADLNAQPDYRRHLARVLTRRALEHAVGS